MTRVAHLPWLLPLALACLAPTAQAEDKHELEPVLDAVSLAPAALLSGPGFQVDPHVEIRGYMAHFTLDTPVGVIHAESVEILADRVAELPALEALDEVTKSEAFTSAAGDALGRTARGLGQVLGHPIDTLVGLPMGVARYFGNQLRKLGERAQKLSDRAARQLGTDGNPYPRDEGPMTEARSVAQEQADAPAKKDKRWYDRAGAEIEREIKRQVKYSQVKRELAERLGIDPYTSNPYVRERLDDLAWVGSGGRFAATGAIGAVGGTAGLVIDQGTRINDIVWKLDPDQIRERNATRLAAYARDELLMRQFLRRGVFTPTLQTALLDALDDLRPASGGDALLELAMTASSELEARFVVNALKLLARGLGERAHGGTLLTIGSGLAYDAADGERVLPLPVDYLPWTVEVEQFIDNDAFRRARKSILVSGEATMRTQRELTSRGWSIHLRAPAERLQALSAR
ncbi:hypothetical protein ACQQ2N_21060 [Dokdonella sp. MW10]|uniref:hypothetical protein n=1 Tax=Dokdonella sp. MW10 TaxID=2992926 RepID=UPI003F803854